MPVFNLFSKRMKEARGEYPDVYSYDNLPAPLRAQIMHIITDGLGEGYDTYSKAYQDYAQIENVVLREHGLLDLRGNGHNPQERLLNYFLNVETEKALDIVEVSFCWMDDRKKHEDLVMELNTRFKEAGIGYKLEGPRIMRIDSEFVHSEVVKPALAILHAAHLKGAQEEFLNAHAHYRSSNHKECLNECLKAFESTMKGICAKRKWAHDPKATAKVLLDLLFAQNLIPQIMQSHFSGLRSTLEAGVPTARNKLAGHGQGVTPVAVPQSIASYVLHLTATNIVFLAKLDSELP